MKYALRKIIRARLTAIRSPSDARSPVLSTLVMCHSLASCSVRAPWKTLRNL
ncbi:hypothetical protein K438DRAFT_1844660 [Mycena galopus ATCC 62051]|nr:hypothetical protein K438DRAFT_1844660 [Mycena galopus ATCC 62051]